ncbi:MAG TPA: UDP-N-acetylglucosamine 1-carboxyvinyltransferase [Candidatus Portnoybacteria bacterium]|nr:UDP-N-acetylglucosamine 1-carboxyvinyltransferase [Candidatus Portnoybacteria bacterium]
MSYFLINGGQHLNGEINVRGFKNAATPILVASLLSSQPSQIENIPLIEDIFRMVELLESLGADVNWIEKRSLVVQSKFFNPEKINQNVIRQMRSSILLWGLLAAKCKEFQTFSPGGCLIGARSVETHLNAFRGLGWIVETDENGVYLFKRAKNWSDQDNREIVLDEFSVTATENLMIAASTRPGQTKIEIAATDPSVQDLGKFLIKMGVRIKGLGTHTLIVRGQKKLKGVIHKIIPDPIEAGTFLLLGAATKSSIVIKNAPTEYLLFPLKKIKEVGVNFSLAKNKIIVRPSHDFNSVKIQTLPYPGFPTDLQAPTAVLLTQAKGVSLVYEVLYEGRFRYVQDLIKMGANISISDPHQILITGPTPLYGKEIKSYDLRAGASLIIAALMAQGESKIDDIYQVDRGYEKIEERLQKIGAEIKRVEE